MDKLHDILLEMMSDIHEALTSESVNYYVVGGAAIGLLRNGDLIPWDDDVDIVFFRKDRSRIQDALLRHLSEKYIVETPNSHENHKGYLRVVKRDTCLIRSFRDRNDRGVCVELFEMIDVPPQGCAQIIDRHGIPQQYPVQHGRRLCSEVPHSCMYRDEENWDVDSGQGCIQAPM